MKKMMKAVAATALTVVALVATSGAEAALVERLGGKAIYDDVADQTWLQDANYAQTSGYSAADANGWMTWADANSWAGTLNIDGVTGWRLPAGSMTWGYNNTASEMGNLFYNVLGGTAGHSIWTEHNANYDLFTNIQVSNYWSGVEVDSIYAWYSAFVIGFDASNGLKSYSLSGWAVHDGDVGASPVPIPATLFLLAPALAGLGVMRLRAS